MKDQYILFDPETNIRIHVIKDYAARVCYVKVNDDPEVRTMRYTEDINLWSLANMALKKCIAERWHITGQRLYDESKAGLL